MIRKRGSVRRFVMTAVFTASLLGVSYAAHTSMLTGNFDIGTSNMNFIFNNDDDSKAKVTIQQGSDGEERELSGNLSYDNKRLTIADIGPIDMDFLSQGNAVLTIQYAIKTGLEERDGLKHPAEVSQKTDNGYDLGTVDFIKTSQTPIWDLNIGHMQWGTASQNCDSTPDIIYDILPDSLGTFHAYNTMIPDLNDGITRGELILKQETGPDLSGSEIGLSSLDLPSGIAEKAEKGNGSITLQIEGTYGFVVPLDLEQFNTER